MRDREPSLADRQAASAKAKKLQLERALAKLPANDPDFPKRQAERDAIARARDARTAERKAAALAREEAERIQREEAEIAKREADAAALLERAAQETLRLQAEE